MKNTDHFNIPYPETTDLVSQFPDQVAKSTAELIDTFLHEQEQKQTAIDAALAGKAPLSHTHPQSQVTGLDAALAGKAPLSHTHPQSQVTGLDAALAGKAPLSHTHPQSQVTGLDAALAGKAPLTTLNTRVPENLALRVDTTVGTRIFAGDTMIYGDTGLRAIDHLLVNGWASEVAAWPIRVRRVGNVVELRGYVKKVTATSTTLLELPAGFGVGSTNPKRAHGIASGTFASTAMFHLRVADRQIELPAYETWTQTQMYIHATWTTTDAWPTVLP